ncbi:hypothetical protein MRB53_037837 [Persea americana]|nr:hypothetical protein MRB53_037837 [Persea americana]
MVCCYKSPILNRPLHLRVHPVQNQVLLLLILLRYDWSTSSSRCAAISSSRCTLSLVNSARGTLESPISDTCADLSGVFLMACLLCHRIRLLHHMLWLSLNTLTSINLLLSPSSPEPECESGDDGKSSNHSYHNTPMAPPEMPDDDDESGDELAFTPDVVLEEDEFDIDGGVIARIFGEPVGLAKELIVKLFLSQSTTRYASCMNALPRVIWPVVV